MHKKIKMSIKALMCLTALSLVITAVPLNTAAAESGSYRSRRSESAFRQTENSITVAGADYIASAGTEIKELYGEKAAVTDSEGYTEYTVNIPQDGSYALKLRVSHISGNRQAAERSILIDGILPFNEAELLSFPRIWRDTKEECPTDSHGNQLRPEVQEVLDWRDVWLTDSTGYTDGVLLFDLAKGMHKIKLLSVRGTLAVSKITLTSAPKIKKYAEYNAEHPDLVGKDNVFIEAEKYAEKSDYGIVRYQDRSSAFSTPQDPYKIRLNIIGGSKWQSAGQFISYEIPIKTAGRYQITVRYRQNAKTGSFVTRRVILDGDAVPFEEAARVEFPYGNGWRSMALGADGQTFSFYLSEGTHTLTFEAGLGRMADLLERANTCLSSLNAIYRNILTLTGSSPDTNRDYEFEIYIPETVKAIGEQAKLLDGIYKELQGIGGGTGQGDAILGELSYQLNTMYSYPDRIAKLFSSFKSNVSAMGTWLLSSAEQPLELDSITVQPYGNTVKKANGNIFKQAVYSVKTFFASFVIDYNCIGQQTSDRAETVEVWLTSGRDQAQIIKTMTEKSSEKLGNINAVIKLVGAGTLLPTVVSGNGPDVSLFNGANEPIDYAVRGAAADLSAFDGYEEIVKRFEPSALTAFSYRGKTYALPDSLTFPVMFYRTDIFEEMGWKVPETWDEFYGLLPEIQKQNMEVGFPADITGLKLFMYRDGYSLYNSDLTETTLGTDRALDAFSELTRLYTIYGLPVTYAFADRFRSGEVPLAIADYITNYNQLSVFAPEIKGLWSFTVLPSNKAGTAGITPVSGTGTMILKNSQHKNAAWKFLKWWTDDATQAEYSNEMEAVVGAAAKQATANKAVLKNLGWSGSEYRILQTQLAASQGTPEIPGGYYIGRYFGFAFNSVYNNAVQSDRAMLKYTKTINEELARKRLEFEKYFNSMEAEK